jgi:hypothetical protein
VELDALVSVGPSSAASYTTGLDPDSVRDTEAQLDDSVGNLSSIVDRLGRILVDLAPHLSYAGDRSGARNDDSSSSRVSQTSPHRCVGLKKLRQSLQIIYIFSGRKYPETESLTVSWNLLSEVARPARYWELVV